MPAIIDRWLTSFGEKTDYLTIGRYRPGLNLRQFTVKTLHPELVHGAVARLVGIEVGVVSGVFNLELPGVSALGWRLRHEEAYHAA